VRFRISKTDQKIWTFWHNVVLLVTAALLTMFCQKMFQADCSASTLYLHPEQQDLADLFDQVLKKFAAWDSAFGSPDHDLVQERQQTSTSSVSAMKCMPPPRRFRKKLYQALLDAPPVIN
jgi:hypothetical protein